MIPSAGDALGRKADSAEGRTFELVFNFQRLQDTGQFFQVVMTADEGPLGSSAYRLALDAIPVAGNPAFLRPPAPRRVRGAPPPG